MRLVLSILLSFVGFSPVNAQFLEFDTKYLSSDFSKESILELSIDSEMNIVYGVMAENRVSYTDYQKSFLVVKSDTNNNEFWSLDFRSQFITPYLNSWIFDLTIDENDDIYISGMSWDTLLCNEIPIFDGGKFFAKISSEGEIIWVKSLNERSSSPLYSRIEVVDDFIYYGSGFKDTLIIDEDTLISLGGQDCFLTKLSSEGETIFSRQFGSPSHDYLDDLKVYNDEIILTGGFEGNAQHGDQNLLSTGSYDVYICSFGTDGEHKWSVRGGGEGYDRGFKLAVNSDYIFVLGNRHGISKFGDNELMSNYKSSDVFLCCLDHNGNFLWAKGSSSIGNAFSRSLVLGEHSIYIMTYFASRLSFDDYSLNPSGGDILICELDFNGNVEWLQHGEEEMLTLDTRNGLFAFGGTRTTYYYEGEYYCKKILAFSRFHDLPMIGELPETIHVYPNPFKDDLNVVNLNEVKSYTVFNSEMREVANGEVNMVNQKIDLSHLSIGVYYMYFDDGTVKKIVKRE